MGTGSSAKGVVTVAAMAFCSAWDAEAGWFVVFLIRPGSAGGELRRDARPPVPDAGAQVLPQVEAAPPGLLQVRSCTMLCSFLPSCLA